MTFKNKISIIFIFCIILCIGAYFIFSTIFENLENQLIEKCHIEAMTGARVMSEIMHMLIDTRVLTEEEIFDRNYKKIKGTNPPKYHTKYDRVFDKYIQKIEDEFLLDQDVEYAVLADANCYVPTHNSKYSQKETKMYDKDLVYSRSKRIFCHFPAIKKAVEYKGERAIRLLYYRDTGETMWNIGAPVYVRGKHWGAFLVGVSLRRINIIKNQMIIMIVITMAVIISLTMLAGLAVMPRKMFTKTEDTPKY